MRSMLSHPSCAAPRRCSVAFSSQVRFGIHHVAHWPNVARTRVAAGVARPQVNAAAVSVQQPVETITDGERGIPTNEPSRTPDPAIQPSAVGDTWAWTKCWYPVMPLDSLTPSIPQHIDLLGRGLVVWGDSSGNWFCVEDRCPHRLAPLSEGRVEGGHIQCCYHGWTFDGAGRCSCIPQISDPKAAATACSSKRAAVAAFPTRVSHGLLWVWPQPGEGAETVARTAPLIDLPDPATRTPWLVRDMPVRFDTLIENILDSSHIPFAHHGVQGSRYSPNVENMKLAAYAFSGFQVERKPAAGGPTGYVSFEAPYKIRYGKGDPHFFFLVIPTKPGWCRLLTNSPAQFAPAPWHMKLYMTMTKLFPGLYHALVRNVVLDGDTYMLHVAERLLPSYVGSHPAETQDSTAAAPHSSSAASDAKSGDQAAESDLLKTWAKACFMPANADVPVLTWHKWLGQFGGAVPTCTQDDMQHMPPLLPKEQVLDRFSTHTKYCVHCQRTVKAIDILSGFMTAMGAAAALAVVIQAVRLATVVPPAVASSATAAVAAAAWFSGATGTALGVLVGALAFCAVCVGVRAALHKLRAKFFYEDYVHALKD